jgi:sulfur carrier protein
MIQIMFNQKKVILERVMTLADVLQQFGYKHQTFAVAVNRSFVAQGHYASVWLNDNDNIDIILPMQGG